MPIRQVRLSRYTLSHMVLFLDPSHSFDPDRLAEALLREAVLPERDEYHACHTHDAEHAPKDHTHDRAHDAAYYADAQVLCPQGLIAAVDGNDAHADEYDGDLVNQIYADAENRPHPS